ncbi:EAL domain-containing protein [Methylobacillus arboreus]|uniref:putative bifunctional diguanylate cyclase/phosphodiesterase n=1 Tax=Methylobacillus arboreus TaxID=755170 RepID=UPI001E311150|nr:GGDEF domain-containing response regulator [Methylobacillus arboreus]MCB5190957.1 EAL domain-containing protein [Methylobacillus arboreus]
MNNRVLIISACQEDVTVLKHALGKAEDDAFIFKCVGSLSQAVSDIQSHGVDAILVDMHLPDSDGIETFDKLFELAPQTPIIVLCASDDEALAAEAVQHGAQSYLAKGFFGNYFVPQLLRNIIQRKAVEEAAFFEKARAEITLNSISDAVIGTDMAGNVDYLNIAAERLTGWPRTDAQGHAITEIMQLVDGATRHEKPNPVIHVLKFDTPTILTPGTILIQRDGGEVEIEDSAAPIHDSKGKIKGAVIVFHDTTAEHLIAKKMEHLAQHDFLTNLPNRLLLNDRISQAIAYVKRHRKHLGVLFLDLDNFKHINDSLGHEAGDQLLKSIAHSLCSCVRNSDTVSRQGGDEFVILVMYDNHASDLALTSDKILQAISAPHIVAKQQLYVTTSIGISVYPEDGIDADSLIRNADTAMYHAKEKGRNNYQFFKNEMNVRAVERQVINASLRQALELEEFLVHYQPKVNLKNGKITGSEALIRWMHPERGLLMPDRFINIAEDSGLIVPIGRWILHEACRQLKKWQAADLHPGSVAVNISAVEFRHRDFVESVRNILAETGLDPKCLQLEITETVLMRDAAASNDILKVIKDMGVQLAVDDFGTGYSSLSYLTQFPIDVLKIDQSFVKEIKDHEHEGIIVSAVIAMGNSLKLKVIAEGIEEEEQLAFLRNKNCEEGQGYIFSRPVCAEQFASLLASDTHDSLISNAPVC